MTTDTEVYVGIDVGKTWLDIALWGEETVWRVSNDEAGVAELLGHLEKVKPTLIVVEASGGYEQLAAQTMLLKGLAVAVVNPTRVRALAKAMGWLAKTDKIDAHLIAEFAYRIRPVPQEVREEREIQLKALVSRREQLVEMCAAEKNRLGTTCSGTKADVREHIHWLQTRIQQLEAEIQILAAQLPQWEAQVQRLDTIPGVGFITAITIVTEMPELGHLDRQKIAALAGLAPFNHESGKKRGKRRIFGGRKSVRRVLYMACLSAIHHNPVIQALYQRLLTRGKCFKVAITACMRKLLIIMNAMARENMVWLPPQSV